MFKIWKYISNIFLKKMFNSLNGKSSQRNEKPAFATRATKTKALLAVC